MLDTIQLEDKTYEELMDAAINQIPLYSKEWTNFNPSDPGITILENLTAFSLLQQSEMDEVPEETMLKLLQLAGFYQNPTKCSRVFLKAVGLVQDTMLANHQKFFVEDTCYEVPKKQWAYAGEILGIYGKKQGESRWKEFPSLRKEDCNVGELIFGKVPREGDCFMILVDRLPRAGEDLIFYFKIEEVTERNRIGEERIPEFAVMEWFCLTEAGYIKLKVKDRTSALLTEGAIRMEMPKEQPKTTKQMDREGYLLKCRLRKADYDIAPKIKGVHGFLFEVEQKDSKAVSYSYHGASEITVNQELLEEAYLHVYVKECLGQDYYLYQELTEDMEKTHCLSDKHGRYYKKSAAGDGSVLLSFGFPPEHNQNGYTPLKRENSIRVVCCHRELMPFRQLDVVYGYDNQEMELPAFQNIDPGGFSVITAIKKYDTMTYRFFPPNAKKDGDLKYNLREKEQKLVIYDPGFFEGATLYIGTCQVTKGSEGNIREGVSFESHLKHAIFKNPGPGTGGNWKETLDEVKKRFKMDLNQQFCGMTGEDYEYIVKNIPGLCIQKVKASYRRKEQTVEIVVKPWTEERFSKLSLSYQEWIRKYLEDRRMLTTKITIKSPIYIPIYVKAVVCVKETSDRCKKELEQVIAGYIDGMDGARGFRDRLSFHQLFRLIESRETVVSIYELYMEPQGTHTGTYIPEEVVRRSGGDILLAAGGLSFLEGLTLELRNQNNGYGEENTWLS